MKPPPTPGEATNPKGSPTDVPAASRRRTDGAPAARRSAASSVASSSAWSAPAKTATPGPPSGSTMPAITVTGGDAADQREVLSSHQDGTEPGVVRPPAQWSNFAPRQARRHSRPVSLAITWAGAVARLVGHEWTVVCLGALALSAAVNWTVLRRPTRSLPQDAAGSAFDSYLIAWWGHALPRTPTRLWDLPAFHPAPPGLALPDLLLGYAPLALAGSGPAAAALRYNVLVILALALAFVGPYALARQLGLGRVAAGVAGVAMALAPWRLAGAAPLAVLSTGGVTLALAMLARGHGVRPVRGKGEPTRPRPGWALVGWLVAAWQLTLGLSTGVPFAYTLLGLALVAAVVAGWRWARRGRRPSVWLLVADGVGALVLVAVAWLLSAPYRDSVEHVLPADAARDVAAHSPSWRGLLVAPADSLIWGGLHAGARTAMGVARVDLALLSGYTLAALAVGGLLFSVWSVPARLAMLAGVAVSVWLALGTAGPGHGRVGYLWLVDHAPGFAGLREPGRLIFWTTLLLALLAAGGVAALVRRTELDAQAEGYLRPPGWVRAVLLVPFLLLLVEGLGTPAQPRMAAPPAALAAVPAPYLVLPSTERSDAEVLLWSTAGFPVLLNGAGHAAPDLARTRTELASFPSPESIDYLRGLGVRTVVVLPARAGGTPWADAAAIDVEGFGITREVTPEAVLFRL